MHIIPLNIGDFSQATERFKPVHLGIFLRLLMEYYKSEKALVDDMGELEWIAGVESKTDKDALNLVLRRCFVHDPARKVWIQRRSERELENYRLGGIQKRYAILCRFWDSVNPGSKKPTLEEFTANVAMYYDEATRRIRPLHGKHTLVLQSYSDRNTELPILNYDTETRNQKPVTSNQNTPIVPKGTDTVGLPKAEDCAEAIYALYPKKVGRLAALKAIDKALRTSGLTELEMQGKVRDFAKAIQQRLKQDPTYSLTFVPHPATWFNQGRYMDDPAEWSRMNPVASKGRDLAEKKEGGAPPAIENPAPARFEEACMDLFGHIPAAWPLLGIAEQSEIRAWCEKKEGGAAES
jgi:hypothetical protein